MVPHEALLAKLNHIGIQGCFLSFIHALYSTSTIQVHVSSTKDGQLSSLIPYNQGICQGCPLSSVLFFIDDILDERDDTNLELGVQIPIDYPKQKCFFV